MLCPSLHFAFKEASGDMFISTELHDLLFSLARLKVKIKATESESLLHKVLNSFCGRDTTQPSEQQ